MNYRNRKSERAVAIRVERDDPDWRMDFLCRVPARELVAPRRGDYRGRVAKKTVIIGGVEYASATSAAHALSISRDRIQHAAATTGRMRVDGRHVSCVYESVRSEA